MFLFSPGTSDPSRRPDPPPPPRPLRDRPRDGSGGGCLGLLRPRDSEEDRRQGETTRIDDASGSFGKIRESALEECVENHVWYQREDSAAVIGLDISKNQLFKIYKKIPPFLLLEIGTCKLNTVCHTIQAPTCYL